MNAIRIAPSILAADFTRLGAQITEAETGGGDLIHIDIMDGRFVPNISMGPMVVAAARRVTQLPLDVHLMIVEPERQIPAFIDAGADNITVHYETCPHLHRTIQQIREGGAAASVVINPHTPVSVLKEVLPLVDMVLLMTVNPGYGGQEFIMETLPKIRELRTMIDSAGLDVAIQVDGGVDVNTAPQVVAHGATVLVAGTSVFGASDGAAAGIAALRHALETVQTG